MKLSSDQYLKKYKKASKIVPAIKKVNSMMTALRNEDEFAYTLLKRLRSWIQKIYSLENPRPLKGYICDEWLENPNDFVMFMFDLCCKLDIPMDEISVYTVRRIDSSGGFSPDNITIVAPASRMYNE